MGVLSVTTPHQLQQKECSLSPWEFWNSCSAKLSGAQTDLPLEWVRVGTVNSLFSTEARRQVPCLTPPAASHHSSVS